MILILSKNYEPSTDHVIDWLYHRNISFKRINGANLYYEDKQFSAFLSSKNYSFSPIVDDIESVWFRKWFGLELNYDNFQSKYEGSLKRTFNDRLESEFNKYCDILFDQIPQSKWLSNIRALRNLNKFSVLRAAALLDIDIPDTLVTSDSDVVKSFISKHGKVITKPLSEMLVFRYPEYSYNSYTTIVSSDTIKQFPIFSKSFFQEYLNKDFEIRTFYIEGVFYSTAILFKKMEQRIDSREVPFEEPDRHIPYKLPIELEVKLAQLFEQLNIRTASLDIVKTKDNRYVFLEMNPSGQYGAVADYCNYPIDELIANKLINLNKTE
jgi:hypothetical protein